VNYWRNINYVQVLAEEHKAIVNALCDDGVNELDRYDIVRGIVTFADAIVKVLEEEDRKALEAAKETKENS